MINSTKLIELADADYIMLKEKGKEGEKVLHYNGYLDGFAKGYCEGKEDTRNKAKEAFGKACGWLSTYQWYQAVAEEFVKAMED